jgi:hypothetical protein
MSIIASMVIVWALRSASYLSKDVRDVPGYFVLYLNQTPS